MIKWYVIIRLSVAIDIFCVERKDIIKTFDELEETN